MAKRMYDESNSKLEEVSEEEIGWMEIEELSEESEEETVRIILLKDVKLNYVGKITGNLYVFNGCGSELDVNKKDAEIMLMRKGSPSCCGSQPTPYFDVVR